MGAQHVDVLIVGAGLSGIGAAYRLQTEHPHRTYTILEARDAIGGTWDLFRYPGVRSDSDMFTLSYPFRPWADPTSIADGDSIRTYIRETAAEFGIDRRIHFGRRAVSASWSSKQARWTVEVETAAGPERYTCGFLYLCCGYYSYDSGHAPDFPGIATFRGTVVHPQQWPEDLDHTDREVVVIGSGATAVTLVPALAERAAHVTMLQRSPTYVTALPRIDSIAQKLRKVLPGRLAHHVTRGKNVLVTTAFYQLCRRAPGVAKRVLRAGLARHLPDRLIDTGFTPRYEPWDQRLCVVPDGDLFHAIRRGRVSVVTDHIAEFTEHGIRLATGREVRADVAVTATGLTLRLFGGVRLRVDGADVDASRTYVYRGCMLSGVPNMALCIGYTNASWTLRADLTSRYVCKLLAHMDRHRYAAATPVLGEPAEPRPLLPLSSGYVLRALATLPKQSSRPPWVMRQNYLLDMLSTRFADVARDMVFTLRPSAALCSPEQSRTTSAAVSAAG